MNIDIRVESTSEVERELFERIGRQTMRSFVLEAGAHVVAQVIGRLAALGLKGDPNGDVVVVMRTDLQVEKVRPVELYQQLVDAAEGPAPAVDHLGNREYEAWVDGQALYEIMYPMQGADFTTFSEDDQRTHLLLAAEILYGPNRDQKLMSEAVFWAKEDA